MSRPVRYSQPRRLNIVSTILLLAAGAGVYWVIQFGPPYLRHWKSKGILSEAANSIYPRRGRLFGSGAKELMDEVGMETEKKLRAIGVLDPKLEAKVVVVKNEVTVSADYIETIDHPVIKKTTILRFTPSFVMQLSIE